MLLEIRKKLFERADKSYKEFNDKLLPDTGATIGVRVPVVRAFAKEIAKGDYERYLKETTEAADLYQEERMIQGMVIGYAKLPFEKRLRLLDSWVPKINSWGVCDCGTSTLKFLKEQPEEAFAYICRYLESSREYELRFAVVALMEYFITEESIDRILELYGIIRHEGYYVKMGIAWAVSVCYVKFPEKTLAFLKNNILEVWTHNKAIQKIRESRRVSAQEKEMLNLLKRKG